METTSCASKNQLPMKQAAPASSYRAYPAPLAKYEEVAMDSKIFKFTLEKLHAQMGTKFMIPIIGRRELDLHRLFVEVTSRGGFEKIVREKRLKEVTLAFNFPPTATNASFMLRKYYSSLLFDYEQIYYFKATGLAPPTTFVFPHGQSFMPPPSQNKYSSQPQLGILPSLFRQTSYNAAELREGSPVIGVIDGKFESGYLVHVTIGAEKLQGVLYQAPQNTTSSASHPSLSVNKSNVSSPSGVTRRGRRKKSEVKRRGLDLPKSSRSSYNFFYSEEHARLKSLYHGKDRDMGTLGKVIGDLWSNLNKSKKSVYLKMAMKDKERYRKEMEDYHEKLKTGPVICDAVPLQQRLPYPETDMVDANADSYLTPEESSSSESDHEDGGSIVKDIIDLDA